MTKPFGYEELRKISDEELVRRHDAATENVQVGLNYFLEELARRRSERQGNVLEEMTRTITRLTWIIAGLTAVVTIVTVWDLSV